MRSNGALYVLLQWVLVVVVVVCVSEGVAGADSGAVSQREGAALCALLHSTRGDSWRWRPEAEAGAVWNCSVDAAGGLVHNPCSHGGSSWQGVTCSGTPAECSSQACQVTKIALRSYNLSGTIPPDIGNLDNVISFSVYGNYLSGTIPSELGQLQALTFFSLVMNPLTGTIPSTVGNLSNLVKFYISETQLTGSIPLEIGQLTSLQEILLFNNHITGIIPVEIGQLTSLTNMYVFNNELTGPIPDELGQLTALETIYLNDNQLSGPISSIIGKLTSVKSLDLGNNNFTGTIPAEVGLMTALDFLNFGNNQLTALIPTEIGLLNTLEQLFLNSNQLTGPIPANLLNNMTSLNYLYLYSNKLTGQIPAEVGQLAGLVYLVLHINQLTGSIPVEVGQLTALEYLYLYDNHLTGSIPVEVGQLTGLSYLTLYKNELSGSIPIEVGKLTALAHIYLHNNQLTGSIPVEVGQMTALEHLVLDNNMLSGSIPAEIGNFVHLERLVLQNNLLEGSVPETIGQLVGVEEFKLNGNHLEGTLPASMAGLLKLSVIFLQDNMLTGSLDNVFNHSSQVWISIIDASNNRLGGSIPETIYRLHQLRVLSLSGNCFEYALSSALCSAELVEVLSLNGLRGAEGCSDRTVVPLSGVALFNTIGGTIPTCVWALRNLSVLHLTGNGLTGELLSSLPSFSQVTDLSLSHNQLSGTIPLDVMQVGKLDLSYNQFRGEYRDHHTLNTDSDINLEVNRLSGQLPVSSLEQQSNGIVSILRGNMFSCNTIPYNDEYAEDYVCGSRNFNYAMMGFVSAVAVVMFFVMLMIWGRSPIFRGVNHEMLRHLSTLRSHCLLMWTYFNFVQNLDTKKWSNNFSLALRSIIALTSSLVNVMRCAVLLLVVILMGSALLYVVKAVDMGDEYATHSHVYSWFWTLAYMRGVVPAGLLLMVWVVAVSSSFYRVIMKFSFCSNDAHHTKTVGTETYHKHEVVEMDTVIARECPIIVSMGLVVVLNFCVVITVNALYIYSTQQALGAFVHLLLQFSLSVFRLLYSAMAGPVLARSVHNAAANVRFRFMLSMINNLLLPCLVVALTSDACFQGLLVAADEVSTPYSFDMCLSLTHHVNLGITTCGNYETLIAESAPLVPPFTYSNQCGSVLLTSYIPVLLMGYSIQLLLPAAVAVTLTCFPRVSMPSLGHQIFHGILWPDHWIQGGDEFARNKAMMSSHTDLMLKVRSIFCNDVLNNWLSLLTFGLCSPVLAVAIVCCVLLKMFLWISLVGRFTRHVLLGQMESATDDSSDIMSSTTVANTNKNEVTCFALNSLAEVHLSLSIVLKDSFWRLAWCSALFIGLLSWDLATDEVGWLRALWVPLLPLFHVLMLHCIAYYLYNGGDGARQLKQSSEKKITAQLQDEHHKHATKNPLNDVDNSML